MCYQDDIIIYSPTFEQHLEDLEKVLQKLLQDNLKLNAGKCEFVKNSVRYLGFKVSQEGYVPDPAKIEALRAIKELRTVKEVRSLIGAVQFFSQHIKGLWQVAEPLVALTRKGEKFIWGEKQQVAFQYIRDTLTKEPVLLHYPNFQDQFVLYCDASAYGGSGILGQYRNEKYCVIEYFSFLFDKAQRQYSALEREGLALVRSCKHFYHYLMDTAQPFLVKTDHRALKFIQSFRDPTSRIARWCAFLSQFNMEVIPIKGVDNGPADFLSRVIRTIALITEIPGDDKDGPLEQDAETTDLASYVWDISAMRRLQRNDRQWGPLIQQLESGDHDADIRSRFQLDERGILYKKTAEREQLVVPRAATASVLRDCHDSPLAGHYATLHTLRRVARSYFWKGMRADVARYVASCEVCLRYNRGRPAPAPLVKVPIPNRPFEIAHVDLIGPLSRDLDGMVHIVVYICAFTKYLIAVPVPDMAGRTIAEALVAHVFTKFGPPGRLISDRAPNLIAGTLAEVTSRLGVRQLHTTAYYPQGNGLCERVNKDLIRVMTTLLESLCSYRGSSPQYIYSLGNK